MENTNNTQNNAETSTAGVKGWVKRNWKAVAVGSAVIAAAGVGLYLVFSGKGAVVAEVAEAAAEAASA